MKFAPIPENEADRLKSLHKMHLLSTPREADLDRITRLAQSYFDVEIALVSLVDDDRQWFKSRVGLDACQTGRDISFCGHAVAASETLVVENALEDTRFADNPLVIEGPEIRFYAGRPLKNAEDFDIGTLCVISATPRAFSEKDAQVLEDLSGLAETVLAQRALSEAQQALFDALEADERDHLIDELTGLWNLSGFDAIFNRELARIARDKQNFTFSLIEMNDFADSLFCEELLKTCAMILTEASRATDIVGYIGEGRFVVVSTNTDKSMLPTLGEKYLHALNNQNLLELNVNIGMVSGMAHVSVDDMREFLCERSEEVLQMAKLKGKNQYHFEDLDQAVLKKLAMA